MPQQLDLPLIYDEGTAHLLVEPCEHGGWDVTLVPEGGRSGLHVHCRNWQRVERFRNCLQATCNLASQASRRQAAETIATLLMVCVVSLGPARAQLRQPQADYAHVSQTAISYHRAAIASGELRTRFSDDQIALLEKLNRTDRDHLASLPEVVLADQWLAAEERYSVLPGRYESGAAVAKLLIVYLPGQLFGAYEFGRLVRWGPVSSGARASPTPEGLYSLNWKSTGHASSVDPDWFMRWYFNFGNSEGLAFHEYELPGRPASHGCIRLLQRDAEWLFEWGDEWVVNTRNTRMVRPGTPVFIVGQYDFHAPPPWHSPEWLARVVDLPLLPSDEQRPQTR